LGRKVHPIGFRLGFTKDWEAKWYAEGKDYANFLREDLSIRDFIHKRMEQAGISKIEIERFPQQVCVTIWTAKPGVLIGRRGAKVKELRREIERLTGKMVHIEIEEIERPELDAYLVAKNIAAQLERRVSHSRAMKGAAQRAMNLGAKGVKILCGGRLAGAEMARREWVMEGRVPRNTLRADIDFAQAEALTTYGRIGVRVWIYKGDLMPGAEKEVGE
jgi:small subunit ribosomal protein S3